MKKRLSLLALAIFALLVFPGIVNAEAVFQISCDPELPQRGADTTCLVTLQQATEPISNVNIKVEVEDMKLNSFTADQAIWNVGAATTDGFTPLTVKTAGGITSGNIGSISATVNMDAVDCGKVCVTITYSYYGKEGENTSSFDNHGTSTSCTQTPQTTNPPETGSFASYAILAGGAAIAMATISIARKSTKFYRV